MKTTTTIATTLMLAAFSLIAVPTASAAVPSCNGIWYYEETVGPVTVYTDGSSDCTGVIVDDGPVKPPHRDVFVPEFMGCTWAGSYKPVLETTVVTVWVFTCDPPT